MTLLPNSQPRSSDLASTRFDRVVRWMRHRIDGGSGGHSHGAEVPLSKLMPWDTEAGDGPRLLEGPLESEQRSSAAVLNASPYLYVFVVSPPGGGQEIWQLGAVKVLPHAVLSGRVYCRGQPTSRDAGSRVPMGPSNHAAMV